MSDELLRIDARPLLVKRFKRLFNVYERQDGTREVRLTRLMALRQDKLALKLKDRHFAMQFALERCAKLPADEPDVADPAGPFAVLVDGSWKPEGGLSKAFQVERKVKKALSPFVSVAQMFQLSFGSQVQRLIDPNISTEEKKDVKRELVLAFKNALDALEKPYARNEDDTKTKMVDAEVNGQPIRVPIECVAIEYARREVERTGELPTKGTLQTMIIKSYPECVMSETKWTSIWEEAGLKELEKAVSWSQPPKKAAHRTKPPPR